MSGRRAAQEDQGPAVVGHVLGGTALSNDLPLQAGHIPSWRRSYECYRGGRSPLSAVGCCWCCQPRVVFPVAKIIPRISREASGWPVLHPGSSSPSSRAAWYSPAARRLTARLLAASPHCRPGGARVPSSRHRRASECERLGYGRGRFMIASGLASSRSARRPTASPSLTARPSAGCPATAPARNARRPWSVPSAPSPATRTRPRLHRRRNQDLRRRPPPPHRRPRLARAVHLDQAVLDAGQARPGMSRAARRPAAQPPERAPAASP